MKFTVDPSPIRASYSRYDVEALEGLIGSISYAFSGPADIKKNAISIKSKLAQVTDDTLRSKKLGSNGWNANQTGQLLAFLIKFETDSAQVAKAIMAYNQAIGADELGGDAAWKAIFTAATTAGSKVAASYATAQKVPEPTKPSASLFDLGFTKSTLSKVVVMAERTNSMDNPGSCRPLG